MIGEGLIITPGVYHSNCLCVEYAGCTFWAYKHVLGISSTTSDSATAWQFVMTTNIVQEKVLATKVICRHQPTRRWPVHHSSC
jgi:hypothetical protein